MDFLGKSPSRGAGPECADSPTNGKAQGKGWASRGARPGGLSRDKSNTKHLGIGRDMNISSRLGKAEASKLWPMVFGEYIVQGGRGASKARQHGKGKPGTGIRVLGWS